ncbi:MAG: hypothetical protein KIS76_06335 [Pyrinomonadaceae bacterium]|nr:hypothetical protein [Pyrinomonadaceae bacterium]
MLKIVNVTLVLVLILLVIIVSSFVWGQHTDTTKVSYGKNDSIKKMGNLVVKNDLQKYGIEIIASTDPNFESELTQYIGSENSLISLVESAKPFTFFIKNNSSKEIVGVSLRWKFSDLKGQNHEIPQSEANPGVLMGIKPLDPKMKGKTGLINSKATKFFTYFKDMIGPQITIANIRINNPSNQNDHSIDSNQKGHLILNSQKERLLSENNDFSVSIDGIVFDDGSFVGADQNLFFNMLSAQIQARKDILNSLNEASLTGKESTEILDDILSRTYNVSANFAEIKSGNLTPEQVTDYSYRTYLKNLRSELVMKRSVLSDDSIIKQLQSISVSDIITLCKKDGF